MSDINPKIQAAKERAKELNVPLADLAGKTISPNILREITEEAATFYQFIPIERKDDVLDIGMINPDDLKSQEALRFIAQNKRFKPKLQRLFRMSRLWRFGMWDSELLL